MKTKFKMCFINQCNNMIEFNWRTYGTNPKEPYQNFVHHKNVIYVQKLDIYKNSIESNVKNNKKNLKSQIFWDQLWILSKIS